MSIILEYTTGVISAAVSPQFSRPPICIYFAPLFNSWVKVAYNRHANNTSNTLIFTIIIEHNWLLTSAFITITKRVRCVLFLRWLARSVWSLIWIAMPAAWLLFPLWQIWLRKSLPASIYISFSCFPDFLTVQIYSSNDPYDALTLHNYSIYFYVYVQVTVPFLFLVTFSSNIIFSCR